MAEETRKTIVNSWTEWDPLKHIIVGVADGCCIPPSEPASECKIPVDRNMKDKWDPCSEEIMEKIVIQPYNYFKSLKDIVFSLIN